MFKIYLSTATPRQTVPMWQHGGRGSLLSPTPSHRVIFPKCPPCPPRPECRLSVVTPGALPPHLDRTNTKSSPRIWSQLVIASFKKPPAQLLVSANSKRPSGHSGTSNLLSPETLPEFKTHCLHPIPPPSATG